MHELSLGCALPNILFKEVVALKQIVHLIVYFMELEKVQLAMHS